MRRVHLLVCGIFCCLVQLAGCSEGDAPIGLASAEGAAGTEFPVVVIHRVTVSGARGVDTLELAVWSDGMIIWSDGTPGHYLEGAISSQRVRHFLQELDDRGIFWEQRLRTRYHDAGEPHVSITLRAGSEQLTLASWHERYVGDPRITAVAAGVAPLQGRTPDRILKTEPLEYQYFRSVWDSIREQTSSWIPAEGTPIDRGRVPVVQ